MIISEKIFTLLQEKHISQKEFAERTGISPSTISDWKRKKTNPTAEKIMIICQVLDVSPDFLLSGNTAMEKENGRRKARTLVISEGTDLWYILDMFRNMEPGMQKRVLGYMEALSTLTSHGVAESSEKDVR